MQMSMTTYHLQTYRHTVSETVVMRAELNSVQYIRSNQLSIALLWYQLVSLTKMIHFQSRNAGIRNQSCKPTHKPELAIVVETLLTRLRTFAKRIRTTVESMQTNRSYENVAFEWVRQRRVDCNCRSSANCCLTE